MVSIFGVDYVSVWTFSIAANAVFRLILLNCTLFPAAICHVALRTFLQQNKIAPSGYFKPFGAILFVHIFNIRLLISRIPQI
jgi:hypothetical protein